MALTRRTIRKRLLEANGWDPAQVQSQTSGVIAVTGAGDGVTPEQLRTLVVDEVSAMGYRPIPLGEGKVGGRDWFRFCTQETVDERSQGGMLSEEDLRTFTHAGGVLREVKAGAPAPRIDQLKAAFREFLTDPAERFRVRLLRIRAEQIRRLVIEGEPIDLDTFNREIQSRGAGTRLRGVAVDQSLLEGDLPPDRVAGLEAALDSGDLVLRGNYLFDNWSAGFASMDRSLDDAERVRQVRRMLDILTSNTQSPLDRVERTASELSSVGRTTATALGALLFPREVPVSTERVRRLLRTFGFRFSGIRTFEEAVRDIRTAVAAEDFLQLHRFFEWLSQQPRLDPRVRAEFEEFRSHPVHAFHVWVRRVRANQLRQLLAQGEISVNVFNAEIWRLRGPVHFRGEDVSGQLNPLPGHTLDPARIPELREGIESGEIELHGNHMWGAGSAVYGPRLSVEERERGLRMALDIFRRAELSPLARATGLMKISGFGRNIATGLAMVADPDSFAIYNEASQAALERLGYGAGDLEEFEESVAALRGELGAEDFIELDLFLWHLSQQPPAPPPEERRFLKIAPGPQGKYWEECLREGFICADWHELGDLRQYGSRDEIRRACLEKGSTTSPSTATVFADVLWPFVNLRPGDIVIANRGRSHILAIGEVVDPGYEYRPDRPQYPQVVPVAWDTSLSGDVPDQGPRWMNTIVKLAEADFNRLKADLNKDDSDHFDVLARRLGSSGLFFSPEVVSNYLLALQAKRFVILTGISGTGKTQLALAIARYFQPAIDVERPTLVPEDAIEVEVYPYMLNYNRVILPAALLGLLELPPPELGADGVFLPVRFPGGEAPLRVSTAGTGNTRALLFKGEFKKWFAETFQIGDHFLLRPWMDEDTTVGGLEFIAPDTAVRRLVLPNYRVIAVRPDWTDNRGLLGYFNPITESYATTEFLRLLLDAHAEELRAGEEGREPFPFFAILDEMNLARVEHYFSDFLSSMESGEEIELHQNEAVEAGESGDGVAVPRRLRVPRNVYFTGTVNVDETTYMFSPKVLDRAFTIEFNEVDLGGFGSATANSNSDGSGLLLTGLTDTLAQLGKPSTADWDEFSGLLDGELRRIVVELNDLLEGANRHFGYRVANEIGRFVRLAAEQADGTPESLWAALDLAILQKVLPKFHGTQQELEATLEDFLAFSVLGSSTWSDEQRAAAVNGWRLQKGSLQRQDGDGKDGPHLPRTAAKVWRMLDRVRKQGFTAYVE